VGVAPTAPSHSATILAAGGDPDRGGGEGSRLGGSGKRAVTQHGASHGVVDSETGGGAESVDHAASLRMHPLHSHDAIVASITLRFAVL
jgi:hypothetical protein